MANLEIHDKEFSAETLAKFRLEFAQRCFINIQELIRFMDQKAGFLLAAVGILTAALGTLVTRVFGSTLSFAWQAAFRTTGGVFVLAYLAMAFAVIYSATSVFIASPTMLRPDTMAPGLIFPLILLKRFEADEEMYLKKLSGVTPAELLHDYANQIMEIANIYQSKQRQVNLSMALFRWLCVLWIISMVLLLGIIVLP
jgi:hypothetical protein